MKRNKLLLVGTLIGTLATVATVARPSTANAHAVCQVDATTNPHWHYHFPYAHYDEWHWVGDDTAGDPIHYLVRYWHSADRGTYKTGDCIQ
jgi:hypothetical protein